MGGPNALWPMHPTRIMGGLAHAAAPPMGLTDLLFFSDDRRQEIIKSNEKNNHDSVSSAAPLREFYVVRVMNRLQNLANVVFVGLCDCDESVFFRFTA